MEIITVVILSLDYSKNSNQSIVKTSLSKEVVQAKLILTGLRINQWHSRIR